MVIHFHCPHFSDSKQLSAVQRTHLLGSIDAKDSIGYVIRTLSPKEISANMLQTSLLWKSVIRSVPFNLNEMSHKAAMDMIRELLRMNIRVKEVYIDTVGSAEKYEAKLRAAFNFTTIKFTVSAKGDALFKCVSAASIVAKVLAKTMIIARLTVMPSSLTINGKSPICETRVSEIKDQDILQVRVIPVSPLDPNTKKYLSECMEKVFGFPTFIRFSWSTIPKLLEERQGVRFVWKEDVEKKEKRPKKAAPVLCTVDHVESLCGVCL